MKRILPYLAIAALLTAAVMLAMRLAAPGSLDDGDVAMRLVQSVGMVALISAGVAGAFATRPGHAIRDLLIWAAIIMVLMAGYSLRGDFAMVGGRILGELAPSRAQGEPGQAQTIRRNQDGHFYIVAEVDTQPVLFLVDTGATMVALSRDDAERIGIDTGALRFTLRFETAAGTSSGAPVHIDTLELGGITLADVDAVVMIERGQSLLGMSVLNRLAAVEIRGDELVLRP